MAHFYASIQGNRGGATRMGTKTLGMDAHIRGWNLGASVCLHYDKEKETDILVIEITGGSNGRQSFMHLATVYRTKDGGMQIALKQGR
jgi:hypothetical protein